MPPIVTQIVEAVITAVNSMHPKVKVPTVVLTALTVAAAVLAALSAVPTVVPYVSLALTVVTAVSGWFAPAKPAPAPVKKAAARAAKTPTGRR